ncbi:TetR/AcrR family transcriptional regulator [Streptomyces sp. NPDC059853]|uniref:TetR/AcrR family transcriptional regulator n=1 Tax=Streptomyces sp. NPDC059853 TaxID=3346973 RepID=UPI00365D1B93
MPAAPAERADAARNRRKILDAAQRITAQHGAAQLSLDTVAKAADVGVGTVYRRFGDRAGLVFALLEDREQRFRAQLDEGPPPLGPGAPPDQRLRAFLHALVDLVVEQRELLLLAEASDPHARYTSTPYTAQHTHIGALLRTLRPDADTDALADALLAPLAPSLIDHQLRHRAFDPDRIKAALGTLADAVATHP